MAGHKRGKARAERREKAAANKSNAVQQPGASNAAEQPGPSNASQQPGPSIAIQQPGPNDAAQQPGPSTLIQPSDSRTAVQRGVTGGEEEEPTEQITNVEETGPDEPVLHTLPEEQLGDGGAVLTQQENAATEDKEEGEAAPTDTAGTGDDHAGPSGNSKQSRLGNVNPMMAERETKKKRRGRHL